MRITFSWRNDNPNTIWNTLARKLGRQPTNDEAKERGSSHPARGCGRAMT